MWDRSQLGHARPTPLPPARRARTPGPARPNPRPVDAIEQVEADVGLAGDRQRLVEQRESVCVEPTVERNLGPPLQRKGLARRRSDLAVELRAGGEVGVRLVELA